MEGKNGITERTAANSSGNVGDNEEITYLVGDRESKNGLKGKSPTATTTEKLLKLLRRKRTVLLCTGVAMVALMTIQNSTHRTLSSFLNPFSSKKDFIYTSPLYHAQKDEDPVISWKLIPVPFDKPTYKENYNIVYQCRPTPPGVAVKEGRLPRKDLETSVKEQTWFHTTIRSKLNILVMGDSVAMQMGQLLQEAMNIDPRTRTVLRNLEDEADGHESLFWGTNPKGGGSGGYRLLHWWMRRNHGKPLPETSGGGWVLTDVEQLLETIRAGSRRRQAQRRALRLVERRIEDEIESEEEDDDASGDDDDEESSDSGDDRRPRPRHHHHHHHKRERPPTLRERPPLPKKTRGPRAEDRRERPTRPEAKRPRIAPRTDPRTSDKTTGKVAPRTDPRVDKTTGRTDARADKTKGRPRPKTSGPTPAPNPAIPKGFNATTGTIVLPKEQVAADFSSRHHKGKVDVLIFRVSQPWMHWSTMSPENMEKTVEVARELLGVSVVVFLTIPFSNNIVTPMDIQKMHQTNTMIRQFTEVYQNDDVTVLYLDDARLHDTLLRENALQQGYDLKKGQGGWPLEKSYDFALETLQQHADYYSHSIPHVCGDRVMVNSDSCNNLNMVTADGQHLCMKTFGGRFFAGMACVIRCAYVHSDDKKNLMECQRSCNDQYMTLQPLNDFMVES